MNTKNVYLFALFALALTFFANPNVFAATTPLGVGIVPPIQFPASDWDIAGLRVSGLWGKAREVHAIDLGVVGNMTTGSFAGLAVAGGFNHTGGNTTILGLQLAGLTNLNMQKTSVYGVQAALLYNYNKAEAKVVGLQFAVANNAAFTTIYGLQAGLYNKAKSVYGFQIGLVNMATDLHGLQIGLANFHHDGIFKVSPIINFGF